VLLIAKSLVVVAFGLEAFHVARLTEVPSLESGVVAGGDDLLAEVALEAGLVEDLGVDDNTLSLVRGLETRYTLVAPKGAGWPARL
jgi:hypothetical protein